MSKVKEIAYLLKVSSRNWINHDADRIGAALSYYTLLSLAPLVLLSIAVGGMFFGSATTVQQLTQQVRDVAGSEAARLVESLAKEAAKPAPGSLASVVSMVMILVGASGVFAELRSALNKMWDIQTQAGAGWRGLIKQRLLSVGIVLAIGFLLVVSLVASAGLAALGKYFTSVLPVPAVVLEAVNMLISFVGIAFLFAMVLRYVPDVRVEWRHLWVGATLSAVFFTIGKSLIGLYLGRAAVGSLYGAGGSVVVMTVWTYYSAQIFLFGAEFTWVYSRRGIKEAKLEAGQISTGDETPVQR
ncbi:MAG: YihY/virulence factor BrkB family protein [Candidatus Solibacter sp.]